MCLTHIYHEYISYIIYRVLLDGSDGIENNNLLYMDMLPLTSLENKIINLQVSITK